MPGRANMPGRELRRLAMARAARTVTLFLQARTRASQTRTRAAWTPLARRHLSGQRGLPYGQRGLTLVEVLIAVVILSLALLAYLTVTQAANGALADGSEFTLASQAAGDKVAQCQGLGYASLTNGTTTGSVSGLTGGQISTVIGSLDGDATNVGMKQVDVTVSWTSRKSGSLALASSFKETALISDR